MTEHNHPPPPFAQTLHFGNVVFVVMLWHKAFWPTVSNERLANGMRQVRVSVAWLFLAVAWK